MNFQEELTQELSSLDVGDEGLTLKQFEDAAETVVAKLPPGVTHFELLTDLNVSAGLLLSKEYQPTEAQVAEMATRLMEA